jgi:hypothetical protein
MSGGRVKMITSVNPRYLQQCTSDLYFLQKGPELKMKKVKKD